MKLARVLWTTLLLSALVACGGPALGDAVSSGIENVPIPAGATSTGEGQWTVEAPYDDLRAWYEKQMPVGANFNPWNWCEANTLGAGVLQRLYDHVASTKLLSVMIGENPSRILIGVDNTGPC